MLHTSNPLDELHAYVGFRYWLKENFLDNNEDDDVLDAYLEQTCEFMYLSDDALDAMLATQRAFENAIPEMILKAINDATKIN